jgi:hypothetical protein
MIHKIYGGSQSDLANHAVRTYARSKVTSLSKAMQFGSCLAAGPGISRETSGPRQYILGQRTYISRQKTTPIGLYSLPGTFSTEPDGISDDGQLFYTALLD